MPSTSRFVRGLFTNTFFRIIFLFFHLSDSSPYIITNFFKLVLFRGRGFSYSLNFSKNVSPVFASLLIVNSSIVDSFLNSLRSFAFKSSVPSYFSGAIFTNFFTPKQITQCQYLELVLSHSKRILYLCVTYFFGERSVQKNLTRFNFRLKIGEITLFFMMAKTQIAQGITSKVGYNRHIILWDLDNCNIDEATIALREKQEEYNLSDIYIFGDRDNGFNVICFKTVDLFTLIKIIINTKYIDQGFVLYTARRNKATLRLSPKIGRDRIKIKKVLKSYHLKQPNQYEFVKYETGLAKRGVLLSIGE